MKLRTTLFAFAMLSSSTAAFADPAPGTITVHDHRTTKPKPPPPPPAWDAKGWTSLGERTVESSNDHDSIAVGVKDGKFSKLTVVVEDSDLEMFNISIHFANGDEFSPNTKLVFKADTRTRVIDLPGTARVIDRI